jgi:putative SOS response-associated peptidase YedK
MPLTRNRAESAHDGVCLPPLRSIGQNEFTVSFFDCSAIKATGVLEIGGNLPRYFSGAPDYSDRAYHFQPVIRQSKKTTDRELVLMRWGLIPFFTKQPSDVKGSLPLMLTPAPRAYRMLQPGELHFRNGAALCRPDGFYNGRRCMPSLSSLSLQHEQRRPVCLCGAGGTPGRTLRANGCSRSAF